MCMRGVSASYPHSPVRQANKKKKKKRNLNERGHRTLKQMEAQRGRRKTPNQCTHKQPALPSPLAPPLRQPDLDRLVHARTRQHVHHLPTPWSSRRTRPVGCCPVRRPRLRGPPPDQAGDKVGVGLERLGAPAGEQVPSPDRLVVRGREQELAIRVEHERADPVVVAGERLEALARLGVPQLDRLVTRAGRGEAARQLGALVPGGWRLRPRRGRGVVSTDWVELKSQQRRTAMPASSRMAVYATTGAKTATSTTWSCPRSSALVSPV